MPATENTKPPRLRVIVKDRRGNVQIDTTGDTREMRAYAARWRFGVKKYPNMLGWTVTTEKVA